MSSALNATGRSILYSLCNWGEDYPWNWVSFGRRGSREMSQLTIRTGHHHCKLVENVW